MNEWFLHPLQNIHHKDHLWWIFHFKKCLKRLLAKIEWHNSF